MAGTDHQARIPASEARELWRCAEHMADAAAARSLPRFRSPGLTVDDKHAREASPGFDPVTDADRAAESAMRDVLSRLRPQDGVLGEEHGTRDGTSGLTWIIDPIDGTRAYMIGAPTWGTLIAVCDEQGPLIGVIDQPYTGERWLGGLGRAEMQRGGTIQPLVTRITADLSSATLCSTFPEVGTKEERAKFEHVAGQVRLVRYGLDCYAYGLVASGGVDLVIEAGLAAYDICGPIGVVEAAGGVLTDWDGRPAHRGGRALAAANPALHAAALEALNNG